MDPGAGHVGTERAYLSRMMTALLKLTLLLVTVVIPGGFLLLPVYLAWRAKKPSPALDFEGGFRRVPATRRPPPPAPGWGRVLRKLRPA